MKRVRRNFDPHAVTCVGKEDHDPSERAAVEQVWQRVEVLYAQGRHPAIQLAIRHRGRVVLDRAIGHTRGNAPDDPEGAQLVPVGVGTPFCIFSSSKAITAMVVHMLDDRGLLHVDDRVAEYIPEFGKHDKDRITIRHVLCHRAGIPTIGDAASVDLLYDWDGIIGRLCDARPRTAAGRRVAYHAITGGFVLGEVVRRVTGRDIKSVLRSEILDPLRFGGLDYGVPAPRVSEVAVNAFTGHRVPFPISRVALNALGVTFEQACEVGNSTPWLTSVVPSGNIVGTANELGRFFELLLRGGELDGVRVFAPRTVHRAVSETAYRQVDFTLLLPVRYGVGLMLGSERVSAFGRGTPRAFGHLGFINNFGWADPERDLSVGLLTSGKTIDLSNLWALIRVLEAIGGSFPRNAAKK